MKTLFSFFSSKASVNSLDAFETVAMNSEMMNLTRGGDGGSIIIEDDPHPPAPKPSNP